MKHLKKQFSDFIINNAWWKEKHFDKVEKSIWDYLTSCNNCENCFHIDESEDCENWIRAFQVKASKNFIWSFENEKIFNSVTIKWGFNINYCFNLINSENLEYCSNCYECENCFLSSGLVRKKYHILNKQYSKEEYKKLKEEIITDMKQQWIYWDFFPAYFSPTSYNESLSWVYNPMSISEQKEKWFNIFNYDYWTWEDYKSLDDLPDDINNLPDSVFKWWYWDSESKRPFQILQADIDFSKKMWVPLNDRFYIRRLKENFNWMFPSYELRKTKCAKSWEEIYTTLSEKLDSRILSIEEYEKIIY